MNLQEGIAKLKELLFKDEKATEVILKFQEELLNDGTTMIQYDAEELAVGVIVNVLDSNGTPLPLPVGDYVTADGDTFSVVDDMGAIDNVVLVPELDENKGEVVAPAKDAPVEQSVAPVVPSTPKRVIKSQIEEHVFSLEIEGVEPIEVDFSPMFAKVIAENEALKVSLEKEKELNKQMFAIVKEIADEPASTPTEAKQAFSVSEFRKSFKNDLENLYK
jgi:hypothetical protein